MTLQWMRVIPRTDREVSRCVRCEERVREPWDASGLCAKCALEADLFERDGRWEPRPERAHRRPSGLFAGPPRRPTADG